jgi:hypothetical protein
MECDVCAKKPSPKRPFVCPTCARSDLYALRSQLAAVLRDKDDLARRIEAAVATGPAGPTPTTSKDPKPLVLEGAVLNAHDCAQTQRLAALRAARSAHAHRARAARARSAQLRAQMARLRAAADALRAGADADAARRKRRGGGGDQPDEAATARLAAVDAAADRARRRGEAVHAEAARGRAALVRSAARLAGLRRVRGPHPASSAAAAEDAKASPSRQHQQQPPPTAAAAAAAGEQGQDEATERYEIASGLPVWDLRDLNGAPPQQLTASLGAVAQLLLRAAGYLAVRLPAEIVPAGRARGAGAGASAGAAHAAILPPASSYLGLAAAAAQDGRSGSRGESPGASGASTPTPSVPRTASRTPSQKYHPHQPPLLAPTTQNAPSLRQAGHAPHAARPRPLAISKPLPRLRRDDPAAFARFVEAATLLAWDAAWLATATGSARRFDRWTDACALGAALHAALLPSPAEATQLGVFSHGSAHSFLGAAPSPAQNSGGGGDKGAAAAAGKDVRRALREWRLASPTRLLDRVKAYLVADAAGAEWEQVGLPAAGAPGPGAGGSGADGALLDGDGGDGYDYDEEGGAVLVRPGSDEEEGGRAAEEEGVVLVVRRPTGKR